MRLCVRVDSRRLRRLAVLIYGFLTGGGQCYSREPWPASFTRGYLKEKLLSSPAAAAGLAYASRNDSRSTGPASCPRPATRTSWTQQGREGNGGVVRTVPMDVRDYAAVQQAIARTRAEFGLIDIVVP